MPAVSGSNGLVSSSFFQMPTQTNEEMSTKELSLKLILMSALRTIFFKRTVESETSATHNNHHVTAGDGASRSRWSNGRLGRLARAMASRQPGRWARAMPRGMARAMARRMARGMAPGNADDFCVRFFLDNVSANFAIPDWLPAFFRQLRTAPQGPWQPPWRTR